MCFLPNESRHHQFRIENADQVIDPTLHSGSNELLVTSKLIKRDIMQLELKICDDKSEIFGTIFPRQQRTSVKHVYPKQNHLGSLS